MIELLGDEVRFSMPPQEVRFEGRDAVAGFFRDLFGPDNPGTWRLVATRANGQPAAANYVRAWGEPHYHAFTLDVFGIENSLLVEITTFGPGLFPLFGLPPTLPATELP